MKTKYLGKCKCNYRAIFLPGKTYGQGSLVGHSQQGCKESDTTEPTHTNLTAAWDCEF